MAENNENRSNRDTDSENHNDSDSSSSCDGAQVQMFRELTVPPVDGTLMYKVHMEKPNFTIKNGYFSSILETRTLNLPNPITLTSDNEIGIIIRIPRQILRCKYGFEIPVNDQSVRPPITYFNNATGALKYNSSNKIITIPAGVIVNNDSPGYVEFGISKSGNDPGENYFDLCSIDYSIIFDAFKLKTLYSGCCKERKCKHKCRRPDDVIKLETETIFSIINRSG